MTAKILFVGDIHLGRRPTALAGIDDDLDINTLTPAAAWKTTVQWAIDHQVNAVVLAGDVIDHDNDRYEAFGQLADGVIQLKQAGIQTCGISGNHDVIALPKLVQQIPDFKLIGAGGVWESVPVGPIHLVGWSYPHKQVTESPFQISGTPVPKNHDKPTVGLIHGDLGRTAGSYAPISRAELDATGYDAWLLGHIHKPDDLTQSPICGYLGSLVGLDIGETGPHGPWLMQVDQHGIQMKHIPIAPVRWETIGINVNDWDTDDLNQLIVPDVNCHMKQMADELDETRVVAFRITLIGRSKHYHAYQQKISAGEYSKAWSYGSQTQCVIEKLTNQSRPDLDLQQLAKANDPVGILAGYLLKLDSDDTVLPDRLIPTLESVANERHFLPISTETITPEQAKAYLITAGMQALDALINQQEARA